MGEGKLNFHFLIFLFPLNLHASLHKVKYRDNTREMSTSELRLSRRSSTKIIHKRFSEEVKGRETAELACKIAIFPER